MEKRRYSRYPVRLDAAVHTAAAAARQVQVRDFCLGGMFLAADDETVTAMRPAAPLGIDVRVPGPDGTHTVHLTAKIARILPSGIGIAFDNPEPAALAALQAFVVAGARAGAAREGGMRGQAPAILGACAELADAHLRAALERFTVEAGRSLLHAADEADSNVAQSRHFDAIAALERTRARLVEETLARLGGQIRRPEAASAEAAEPNGLALVDKDEFEEFLAFADMTRRAEQRHRAALTELDARFSALLGTAVDEARNPVGPASVCRSFEAASHDLPWHPDARQVALQRFEEIVLGALGTLYPAVQALLEEAGVRPATRPEVPRPKPGPAPPEAEPPAAAVDQEATFAPLGGAAPPRSPPRRGAHPGSAAEPDAPPSGTRPGGATRATDPYAFAADLLSRTSPRAVATGGRAPSGAGPVASPGAAAGAGPEAQSPPPGNMVSLVTQLLESLEHDPGVSPPARERIRRLESYLLERAGREGHGLDRPESAVRRLVDGVAALGSAPHGAGHWGEVDALLDGLQSADPEDSAALAEVTEALDSRLAAARRSYEEKVAELVGSFEKQQAFLRRRRGGEAPPPPRQADPEWERWTRRVRHLQPGDAVQVEEQAGHPIEANLAWVGEDQGPYLFVDREGDKVGAYSLQELVMQMRRGRIQARRRNELPALDRALVQRLATAAETEVEDAADAPVLPLSRLRGEAGALMSAATGHRRVHTLGLVDPGLGAEGSAERLGAIARMLTAALGDDARIAVDGKGRLVVLAPDASPIVAAERLAAARTDSAEPALAAAPVGLTVLDAETRDIGTSLTEADAALQRAAKEPGRPLQVFARDQHVSAQAEHLTVWLERAGEALPRDSLAAFWQPVVRLAGSREEAYRLIRTAPDGVDVPPFTSWDLSRARGAPQLASALDHWCLEQITRHGADDGETVWLLPLTELTLSDPELADRLGEALMGSNLPPGRLCFLVDESVLRDPLGEAATFVEDANALGCRIALGGFGQRREGLAELKSVAAEAVVLDLDSLGVTPAEATTELAALREIAVLLGKQTIAWHVDDATLRDAVERAGLDYAQGDAYAGARPWQAGAGEGPDIDDLDETLSL